MLRFDICPEVVVVDHALVARIFFGQVRETVVIGAADRPEGDGGRRDAVQRFDGRQALVLAHGLVLRVVHEAVVDAHALLLAHRLVRLADAGVVVRVQRHVPVVAVGADADAVARPPISARLNRAAAGHLPPRGAAAFVVVIVMGARDPAALIHQQGPIDLFDPRSAAVRLAVEEERHRDVALRHAHGLVIVVGALGGARRAEDVRVRLARGAQRGTRLSEHVEAFIGLAFAFAAGRAVAFAVGDRFVGDVVPHGRLPLDHDLAVRARERTRVRLLGRARLRCVALHIRLQGDVEAELVARAAQ